MNMKKIANNLIVASLVSFLLLSDSGLNGSAIAYQRSCDFVATEFFDDGNCVTTTMSTVCQVGYEYQYCESHVTICEGGSLSGGFECGPLCTQ